MQQRVQWGIYIWDQHMSLKLSCPLLIKDRDYNVSLLTAINNHYIHYARMLVPNSVSPLTNFILLIINIICFIFQLIKTLKSLIISLLTLATFNTYFNSCIAAFLSSCQLIAHKPLDPRILASVCYLTNAQLIFYCHNLTTFCPLEVRANAIEQCIWAALNSINLFARAIAFATIKSTNISFWPYSKCYNLHSHLEMHII